MSKFDDLMVKYVAENEKLDLGLSEDLIRKVAKGLGPSIYNSNSSKVSGGDQTELDRVKANYLIKKLGLTDSADLDQAVKDATAAMGSSNRNKLRVLVYAWLCKKFEKESIYG